ncbi:hypothetical protein [Providencia sp. 2024EL-00732]|uniref:hypothetical protein n=1 Tax=Providencia sp. 2024EL-00732 TaxID=3374242 RepID=UPI0024AA1BD9
MKKLMAAILFSVVALTGCNEGDNGELAGVYQAENKDQMVLSFDKSDKQYKVDYRQYIDLSKVNKYAKPQYAANSVVGFVVKDGDFLVMPSENNKKVFQVENTTLKAVYNKTEKVYKKAE